MWKNRLVLAWIYTGRLFHVKENKVAVMYQEEDARTHRSVSTLSLNSAEWVSRTFITHMELKDPSSSHLIAYVSEFLTRLARFNPTISPFLDQSSSGSEKQILGTIWMFKGVTGKSGKIQIWLSQYSELLSISHINESLTQFPPQKKPLFFQTTEINRTM